MNCDNNPQMFCQSFTSALYFQELHLNLQVMILTSETPTPCCLEGTPVWFSANERYSGSGTHAVEDENKQGRGFVMFVSKGGKQIYFLFCAF